MILKSLIRFFFLNMSIETLFEKIRWNCISFQITTKYPRTRHGILQAARDEMFPKMDGGAFQEEAVMRHLDDHGVESTIDILAYVASFSGVHISDFIMEKG